MVFSSVVVPGTEDDGGCDGPAAEAGGPKVMAGALMVKVETSQKGKCRRCPPGRPAPITRASAFQAVTA